MVIMC